jgi:SAM-dependent methyltransferase
MYSTDLAAIHDDGFSDLSRRAAPEIVRQLRARGIRSGVVVDVGCGSGISARHFVERGYDVIGIDASKAMIRLARARAPRARFRVASIERLRLPACDAVTAIGEVVTYLGGLSAVARFFRHAHRALRPHGLLVFDFIESAARRTYATRTFAGPDWVLASQAALDAGGRVLTRRMAIVRTVAGRERASGETHRVRIYSRAEIARALARAGFHVRMSRSYGRCRLMAGDVAVVATARKNP